MSIAVVGAHSTGKTTLAKALSAQLNLPYLDASVTKIMADAGFNGVGDLPLEQRIEAQEFLVEKHWEMTQAQKGMFITDRSPLDMIGYMLGEVTMHNCDSQFAQRIQRYVDRCLEVTNDTYSGLIICRPLPVYTVDDKRPPENTAYQSLVQFIIEGAARQCVWPSTLTLDDSRMFSRNKCSIDFISNILDEIELDEIEKAKAKLTLH